MNENKENTATNPEKQELTEIPFKNLGEKERPVKKTNYLLIIILNIIITVVSLFVYHNYILKPSHFNNIVGIDIKGFLEKQKAGMVEGKITEDQFKANMDRLENTVNELGKTKVILMSDVILRGAEVVNVREN
jgi:hypothetical protein